jgi:protein PET117
MSLAAKLTLAGTSVFAISTIFFVHFQQKAEKAVSPKPMDLL